MLLDGVRDKNPENRHCATVANNDESGLGLVSCTALKWLHIQTFFDIGETTRPILLERMLRELLPVTPPATSMGLELVLHRNSLRWFGELDEVVCQYAPDRGLMSVKVFWQEPADDRSWKLAQQRGRELSKEEQSRVLDSAPRLSSRGLLHFSR